MYTNIDALPLGSLLQVIQGKSRKIKNKKKLGSLRSLLPKKPD